HIKNNEPRAAAEMVRKIKFKFTVLSMNNAFDFAEFYEEKLRVGDMSLADDFRLILKKVDTFLKTL
ncbi:MAG: Hpt domain-containing protein, partial [Aurantibacter sp.]